MSENQTESKAADVAGVGTPTTSTATAATEQNVAPASSAATDSTAPSETPSTPGGGAAEASSAPQTASPNSTTADLNNLAQTVGGGAKSVGEGAGAEPTPSPDSAQPKSTSARSTTGQPKSSHSRVDESKRASSPSPSSSRPTSTHRKKRTKLGELDLNTAKIGFLGAGKMAESTINGLIHYAKISPKRIHVAAPSSKGLERFKALGCRVTKRNYDIFGRYDCDIVFLCFHGYVIKHCYKLGGARPHPLTTNYIPHQRHPVYILSLVSGVSMSQIKACLLNPESNSRYDIEVHRIMMNTAVGHGLGICAVDCEPDSKKLSAPLRQLLSAIAQLEHVPASQMDAACAIGGSGLAFAYYFINSLADGAFKMGLSRQQAIRFASKTAQCAAQTMLESGKHPAELRDNVSSPSGAAIYGIHILEKSDVASGVTAAVEAAHKRANDLATQDVSS